MKSETDSIMFDTSALIAYFLDEDGAKEVDYWLRDVEDDEVKGYISVVTLSELAFVVGNISMELANFISAYIEESNLLVVPLTYDIAKQSGYYRLKNKALKLSYGHIVTLASLVEKEARVPQERAVIAGVFYNRLRKRWRLESCASVEYALGKWKRKLSYKDLAVDSPYNTYLHFGLPPGPICNPGQAALEAAAHPAATDMMFFIAEGDGTHRFSRYYKEHLEGKRQRKNHD